MVTQEIGDTWIHGVASDPPKLARIRELVRLRSHWISQGTLSVADPSDLKFLSKFALAVEHTWGTDTKTWLDFDHYTPDDLATMLGDSKYRTVTGSWVEKLPILTTLWLDCRPACVKKRRSGWLLCIRVNRRIRKNYRSMIRLERFRQPTSQLRLTLPMAQSKICNIRAAAGLRRNGRSPCFLIKHFPKPITTNS